MTAAPSNTHAAQNRATARRAACFWAGQFDIPAAHFFRKTRGAAIESFARQVWVHSLYAECPSAEDPTRAMSQNEVGYAIATDDNPRGRHRSTVGHASDLIEDLRGARYKSVLQDYFAPLLNINPATQRPVIDPRAKARTLAYLVCGLYDLGLGRLFNGQKPDEAHARHLLFALMNDVILWTSVESSNYVWRKQVMISKSKIAVARLEQNAHLKRYFDAARECATETTVLRDTLLMLAANPKGALFDLYLEDCGRALRAILFLGREIDREVSTRLTEASPPLAA